MSDYWIAISLFSLAALFLVLGVVSMYRIRNNKEERQVWISLSGQLFTVAAILLSAGGLVVSIHLEYSGRTQEYATVARERTLRERVEWTTAIHHNPSASEPDLDIRVRCFKTADTIEPKQVSITVEIEYLDDRGEPTKHPPRRRFENIQLTPISARELEWVLEDVQDDWETFKDREGRIARKEVLERPLAVSIDLTYNLDFQAKAKAHLYPDAEGRKEVEFEHTDFPD